MVAKSSLPVDMSGQQTDAAAAVDHPVIRTLYDHLEEVTCLVFHPRDQILISGSKDYTVKVFDWSKSSAKKAIKTIQEVEWVRTMSLHPSGDWLIGTFFGSKKLFFCSFTPVPFIFCIQLGPNILQSGFMTWARLPVLHRQFNGIIIVARSHRLILTPTPECSHPAGNSSQNINPCASGKCTAHEL